MLELIVIFFLSLPPNVVDKCPVDMICTCRNWRLEEGNRKCTKWKIIGVKHGYK